MNQTKNTAPPMGEKILKLFLPRSECESIFGDYEEIYSQLVHTKGKSQAFIWFWIQIIKSSWRGVSIHLWWSFTMLKSYITVAFRNLKRHKVYSFINISGLAIGIACCILILLWVNDEIHYDRFHEQADDLYRVVNHLSHGPIAQYTEGTAYPLGPAMIEEIPEVKDFARLLPAGRLMVAHRKKRFYEERFYFADPSFFTILTFPFVEGKPENALSSPSSVVITEEMARKYFGREDPVGQTLQTHNQNDYIVTGVIENIPENSHLQFDFIGSVERAVELGSRTHWTGWFYTTYVLLQPGSDHHEVNQKLEVWIQNKDSDSARYHLQPLEDVHLLGLRGEGPIRSLSFFSFLAALVLIIACINYMNLSTARAGSRAKEIGLRKVVGAGKINIMRQFLSESVLFAFFALAISILLVSLFLPLFNQLADKQLSLNLVQNKLLFLGILGITLLTGLMAGSYPSFFVSSFQPVLILKKSAAQKKIGTSRSSMRKILVVCQFALSIILIIGTTVVYRQMKYIAGKQLGFAKDHLIYMQLRGGGNLWERGDARELWSKYNALRQELTQDPNITGISASACLPFGMMGGEYGQLGWEGKDPEMQIEMNHMAVDHTFLETFKLELADGRFFSDEALTDADNFVLNEKAAEVVGLDSPVGKKFRLLDKNGVIIGVVKDFHFTSLHQEIKPLILHMMPYQYWMYRSYVFARMNSDDISGTLTSIREKWDKVIPEYPFEFHFLDETIDSRYRSEQRFEIILRVFTFLAIFISCFGLFGLISFAAEQRTKEIGIRKVLGASVTNIVRLLAKEFLLLVVIANTIAWPVAHVAMNRWLENFAYRQGLSLGIFVFSGILAVLIAVLTVSFQSIRAALANPVKSLRYE